MKTVTNGKLSVSCQGKGNIRVYVLATTKTPAPGKIGTDTKFIYSTSPAATAQKSYDGNEEAGDFVTRRDNEQITPDPDPDPDVDPETDMYLIGDFSAGSWNLTGWKMDKKSDNVFSYEMSGITGKG